TGMPSLGRMNRTATCVATRTTMHSRPRPIRTRTRKLIRSIIEAKYFVIGILPKVSCIQNQKPWYWYGLQSVNEKWIRDNPGMGSGGKRGLQAHAPAGHAAAGDGIGVAGVA